jgi:hypothetical protein
LRKFSWLLKHSFSPIIKATLSLHSDLIHEFYPAQSVIIIIRIIISALRKWELPKKSYNEGLIKEWGKKIEIWPFWRCLSSNVILLLMNAKIIAKEDTRIVQSENDEMKIIKSFYFFSFWLMFPSNSMSTSSYTVCIFIFPGLVYIIRLFLVVFAFTFSRMFLKTFTFAQNILLYFNIFL